MLTDRRSPLFAQPIRRRRHITSHHITSHRISSPDRGHGAGWAAAREKGLGGPALHLNFVSWNGQASSSGTWESRTVPSPLSSPRCAFNPAGGQSSSLSVLFPARALRVKAPRQNTCAKRKGISFSGYHFLSDHNFDLCGTCIYIAYRHLPACRIFLAP